MLRVAAPNRSSKRKRSAHWVWLSCAARTSSPPPSMDHLPQTPAHDSAPAPQERLARPPPWRQAQVSADRQAEEQELDCRVRRLVLVVQVSQAGEVPRPVSLQDSRPVVLLLQASLRRLVALLAALLALRLPAAAAFLREGKPSYTQLSRLDRMMRSCVKRTCVIGKNLRNRPLSNTLFAANNDQTTS